MTLERHGCVPTLERWNEKTTDEATVVINMKWTNLAIDIGKALINVFWLFKSLLSLKKKKVVISSELSPPLPPPKLLPGYNNWKNMRYRCRTVPIK